MKIALAQIQPEKGDLKHNLAAHAGLSRQAAAEGIALILFPELSLTGYEPVLAAELATDANDPHFADLQAVSDAQSIVICAGMPIRVAAGIQIGMLIFQPDQPLTVYAKQYLHDDEKPFFVAGNGHVILEIGGRKIAPAICYEALLAEHAATAAALGADIYLASVSKDEAGVVHAKQYFAELAKQYEWTVGMSNTVGPFDNFLSAGASAIWNPQGECFREMSSFETGLFIADV